MQWLPLLVVLSLAGVLGVPLVCRSRNERQRGRRLLTLLYFTGLGTILFTPISFDGTAVYVMPAGYGQVNLTRLSVFNAGFAENILLTVPLGMLIKHRFPQTSLFSVAILGLMIGSGIEISQHYLSLYWLINRSSDINDVLANGLGVAVGGLIMAVAHGLTAQRVPRHS